MFQAGTIGVLVLAVQVEVFPKDFKGRFFLKVNFAKNLEVQILGTELGPISCGWSLKKCRTSLKNFEPGGEKPRDIWLVKRMISPSFG